MRLVRSGDCDPSPAGSGMTAATADVAAAWDDGIAGRGAGAGSGAAFGIGKTLARRD